MTNQYNNDRELHIGSVDVRVALYSDVTANYSTAESIGILDGAAFNVTGDSNVIESDNCEDLDFGMSNQQAEVSASAWKNIELETFYKLLGKTGTYATTASGSVAITDESVKLNGVVATPLKNRNTENPPSVVTGVVVTDSTGDTTYAVDTDYVIGLDTKGNTTIARVSGGAISDGAVVKVDYSYTALASKKVTYGSSIIPAPLHVWLINTNAAGKKFIIELYKVSSLKSAQLSFGSDKAKALVTMPISIIGKPDSTRPENDDLFSIYDEQGV